MEKSRWLIAIICGCPSFSLLEQVSVSVESLSMGQWMRVLGFI